MEKYEGYDQVELKSQTVVTDRNAIEYQHRVFQ